MSLPVAGGSIIGVPYQGSHKPGVTSPASWESDNAVDIGVPAGTPVYAAAAGIIGPQFGAFGSSSPYLEGLRLHVNTLGGGPNFYYAHLSRIADGIRPGVRVAAGQLLGYSGVANGVAHLHFAVSKGSPLAFLRDLPGAVADTLGDAASSAGGGDGGGDGGSGSGLSAAALGCIVPTVAILAVAGVAVDQLIVHAGALLP